MKLAVQTLENKKSGDIDLDDAVFGVDVRADLLQRMVRWQQAKQQAGTHKTKGISEVSGTGKKPFKQKGTGNARAGSLRRNIDRGGAVVFGPVVRSHAFEMPKRVRKLAMKVALSAKAKDGKLVILDKAEAKDHKTKAMVEALSKLGATNALIIGGKELDANFSRATNNIKHIDVLPSQGANVYSILKRDTLVLTKDAVNDLTERLKG